MYLQNADGSDMECIPPSDIIGQQIAKYGIGSVTTKMIITDRNNWVNSFKQCSLLHNSIIKWYKAKITNQKG